MNKIFLATLFLFTTPAIYSQTFTARVDNIDPYGYVGIWNPISCTVENTPAKSVVLTTTNGTITREGKYFRYIPDSAIATSLAVNVKMGNKLKKIGDFHILVKSLPKQIANLTGRRNDSITKGLIKAQGGLGCSWLIPGFEINCAIDSFSVTIFRNGAIIGTRHSVSNIFNKDIRDFFELLQANDHVLFSGITSHGVDRISKPIDPIEFIIK